MTKHAPRIFACGRCYDIVIALDVTIVVVVTFVLIRSVRVLAVVVFVGVWSLLLLSVQTDKQLPLSSELAKTQWMLSLIHI